MSTAKRKKRSSSLKGSLNPSKRHRDRFNIELDNLAKLLPFPHDVIQKLDKLSILRLSASYLRAKNFFKGQHLKDYGNGAKSPSRSDALAVEGNGLYSKLLLDALDGFVIVLTQDCELFYASETVQEYLGLSQASVIHQDFLRFIHVDDHEIVKKNLQPYLDDEEEQKIKILDDENDGKNVLDSFGDGTNLKDKDVDSQLNAEKSFVCRMKCILNTSAGFFKPFRCTGRLREMTVAGSEGREYGLFLVCTPLETMTTSILEIRLRTSLFCTKNRMDLSFVDLDQKGRSLLGYHKRDIALQSSYCMIHFDDIPVLQQLHANLMGDGKCQGTFRMLNKNLKWQWLTGTAQVVFKGNEPDFIITTNRPLSDEEGEEIMRQRGQLPALTYYSDGEESSFHLPKSPPVKRVSSGGNRPTAANAELFVNNTTNFKHPPSWFKNSGTGRMKKRNSSSCSAPSPASIKSDSNRGSTSSQEWIASPLQTGSPSPDDVKSPTTCTSTSMSLPDFDLDVDLHVDMATEEPDLLLLDTQDCDFAFDDPPLGPMSSTDESELADSISLLSMSKLSSTSLDGLPTYEEAWLLAQDVISNSSDASQVSPGGRSTASVNQTPPHVQCDNVMAQTQYVGNHPVHYPSPTNSQMGQSMQAPPYVSPTISPDPSPLGQREAERARVNISWREGGAMHPPQQYPQANDQVQFSAPMQQPCGPAGDLTSKSALLATMKKKGTKELSACQSAPHASGNNMQRIWGPQNTYPCQYQDNSDSKRAAVNNSMQQHSYNWNMSATQDPNLNQTLNHNPVIPGQYMQNSLNERIPTNLSQLDENRYQNSWNMHSAQSNSIPPRFEDTLPHLNVDGNSQTNKAQQGLNMQYPDSRYNWEQPPNVIPPPFPEDPKLQFGFPGNGIHKTPTTLQDW